MKLWLSIALVLFLTGTAFSQTARNYYDELYQAGGLDRMADGYACFDDDPALATFFIFGESDTLKQFLQSVGGYDKLSAKEKASLTKGFLTVRGYDKGVPLSAEDTYIKDGDSWITEVAYINKQTPLRMRLQISWQTLRYKRSVEFLNADKTLKSEIPRYGRCELVSPTVQQKAN
jgi:hypothetical protein